MNTGPRKKGVTDAQALEALKALGPTADRSAQMAAVRSALDQRSFQVVAKAAALAGERSLHECVPELLSAYRRFLENPLKRDPNCIAKKAIARALVELECQDVDFFLEGIRYAQREPVWGGTADTAVDIRCSCAMGLAATGYSRAVAELTALLDDPESRARTGAARAIACANPHEAEVLLRFKVLTGDEEPEVIGECFSGLLAVAAAECLPFVAGYLRNQDPAIREYAALALGESRQPAALAHLRAAWDEACVALDARLTLIRAAALHRSEAAFDWLVSLIEHGAQVHADCAVEALSVYERNSKLIERVRAALARRVGENGGGFTHTGVSS
jgi:HEAT repeat protein